MVLVCLLLLPLNCAFSLPDPHAITKKIEKSARDLRGKGPGMRALAAWHKAWDEAEKAMETARTEGAPRYAPEQYAEATKLIERAKGYAGQRSYLKAKYLAMQASKTANTARETARRIRSEKMDKAKERIDSLGDRITGLEKRRETFPPDRQRELDEILLAWRDLYHALALEEFDAIDTLIPKIEKRLEAFAAEITPTKEP
ncbi:MAG: DUF4398 domain-containing protein [Deltaproteobacteria bacterium]